jgi:hypothetical protein
MVHRCCQSDSNGPSTPSTARIRPGRAFPPECGSRSDHIRHLRHAADARTSECSLGTIKINGNPLTFFVDLDAAYHADLLRLEKAAKPILGSVRLPSGLLLLTRDYDVYWRKHLLNPGLPAPGPGY